MRVQVKDRRGETECSQEPLRALSRKKKGAPRIVNVQGNWTFGSGQERKHECRQTLEILEGALLA